ncbi:uncharacterized protein LOC127857163 [Dreissena polymorpha]|nr:uncharacterized protein LOC127857163 [Dreissena polymorpha]
MELVEDSRLTRLVLKRAAMKAALEEVGLGYLWHNFRANKISLEEAKKLTDEELSALGVNTIGDRVRLKEKLKESGEGGRRQPVTLGKVLKFVTGTEEEPVLGFSLKPSIHFSENQPFLPSANTCINRLNLTIPSETAAIPNDTELFNLYDYAFSNDYFGLQ